MTWRLHGPKPSAASPGPQWLGHPEIAVIVAEALLHGEQSRQAYFLHAWVIMPDHVHMVMEPQVPLPAIMRWLKSATAVRANKLIGKTNSAFWQREYYDHWIRTNKELSAAVAYVEDNPVRRGLCPYADAWLWSSAFQRTGDKIAGATLPRRSKSLG